MARALGPGSRIGWRGALVLSGEYFDAPPTGDIVGSTSLSLSPTATLADLPPTEVNFGNETLAGGGGFPCSYDRAYGNRFTLSDDGELVSGEIGFDSSSVGGTSTKLLVYTDAGSNTPGTLVAASTSVIVPSGGGWCVVSFANESITAGDYFLISVTESFQARWAVTAPWADTDAVMANGLSYASPPGTWPGTSTSYDEGLSVFVTVETDAGPPSGEMVGTTLLSLAASGTLINLTPLPTSNFGDENLYTDYLSTSDGRCLVDQFVLTEDGTIVSITVGFHTGSAAGTNMKGVIYADSAGAPGAIVAVGASTAVPAAGGWVESLVADVPLTAGTYWIGSVTDNFTADFAHSVVPTGTAPDARTSNSVTFASPPNWPGTAFTYDYNISAYATYSTAEPEGDIVGSTSIALAPAGVLRGAGALAGTTTIALAPTGTLRGTGTLVGTSSVILAPSATGTRTVNIVGTTTVTLTSSATGDAFGALTGATTVSLAPTGTVAGTGTLVGSVALTLAPTGLLAGAAAVVGSTTLALAPTATLRGALPAAGSTSIALAPAGTLVATGALAGASSIDLDPAGTLENSTPVGLVGSTSVSLAPTGTLAGTGAMSGSASISLVPAATGRLQVNIAGSTSVSVVPAATLGGSGRLVGSAALSLAPAATLGGTANLVGATSMALAPTGALSSTAAIVGSTTLSLVPAGTARGTGAMVGSASISLTPAATLAATGRLVGSTTISFSGQAIPAGGLTPISGATSITLAPSAALGAIVRISGAAALSVAPSATLGGTANLSGQTTMGLVPSATGNLTGRLDGAALISMAMVAELLGQGALAGTATMSITARATPEGYVPSVPDNAIIPWFEPPPAVVVWAESAIPVIVWAEEVPTVEMPSLVNGTVVWEDAP